MTHSSATIHPDEAMRIVLTEARPVDSRSVPLQQAVGRRLAEDVRADRDYPPFDRAMMDGYAIESSDLPNGTTVELIGQVAAGDPRITCLRPGTCLEVMTGAACPEGTAAVVPKEQTTLERGLVKLSSDIRFQQHVAAQGTECRAGDIVLHAGDLVTPLALAALASVGREVVRIVPLPSIGILTTGGELVGNGETPGAAQIRDSNGSMLAAMAHHCGLASPKLLRSPDDVDRIVESLEQLRDCDIVILTGGVSMGRYDLVPDSLRRFGAEVLFHKVAQKPGKPLLFARGRHQLLFGLPGNPLAVHLCFHRYVSTAIRRLGGQGAAAPDRLLGTLCQPIGSGGPRTWFLLARAEPSRCEGEAWRLHPLPGHSSADLFSTNQATCYIEIPAGNSPLGPGQTLAFEWLSLGAAPGPDPAN